MSILNICIGDTPKVWKRCDCERIVSVVNLSCVCVTIFIKNYSNVLIIFQIQINNTMNRTTSYCITFFLSLL